MLCDLVGDLFVREKERYSEDAQKVRALLSVGDQRPDRELDPVDVAATTIVCSTILSFDETLMKR